MLRQAKLSITYTLTALLCSFKRNFHLHSQSDHKALIRSIKNSRKIYGKGKNTKALISCGNFPSCGYGFYAMIYEQNNNCNKEV